MKITDITMALFMQNFVQQNVSIFLSNMKLHIKVIFKFLHYFPSVVLNNPCHPGTMYQILIS